MSAKAVDAKMTVVRVNIASTRKNSVVQVRMHASHITASITLTQCAMRAGKKKQKCMLKYCERDPKRQIGLQGPLERITSEPLALPPLRNAEPLRITEFGFMEAPQLLSLAMCKRLSVLSLESAVDISNALQQDISGSLHRDISAELLESKALHDAVHSTFGTDAFSLHNLKILESPLGSDPQIPHADDFCNRELFLVIHLRQHQQPTQCVRYNATVEYPTFLSAPCTRCNRYGVP